MAGTVDTMLSQNVNTWKQFSDGILIQTDITTSSLINSAKQFCWVGDRVIWRERRAGRPRTTASTPSGRRANRTENMSVEDFKATRGLPGTEFSVYVINEETLLDASAVFGQRRTERTRRPIISIPRPTRRLRTMSIR